MNILAIDYGRKKIGLAIATSKIAEPLKVIRFNSVDEVLKKIEIETEKEKIEKVVIGVSEGKMAEETKVFSQSLSSSLRNTRIKVELWDETLTTQTAQLLSREAGIKRKKRRKLEDAYSAALILQSYLDNL